MSYLLESTKLLIKAMKITPSTHLLILIENEINLTNKIKFGQDDVSNNYSKLIDYITILIRDILAYLKNQENNLNSILGLIDYYITLNEYTDDFDDSNIIDYDDTNYNNYIKSIQDDYEFSSEEGYDNWFGK